MLKNPNQTRSDLGEQTGLPKKLTQIWLSMPKQEEQRVSHTSMAASDTEAKMTEEMLKNQNKNGCRTIRNKMEADPKQHWCRTTGTNVGEQKPEPKWMPSNPRRR